jgi:hypothetical protein
MMLSLLIGDVVLSWHPLANERTPPSLSLRVTPLSSKHPANS